MPCRRTCCGAQNESRHGALSPEPTTFGRIAILTYGVVERSVAAVVLVAAFLFV